MYDVEWIFFQTIYRFRISRGVLSNLMRTAASFVDMGASKNMASKDILLLGWKESFNAINLLLLCNNVKGKAVSGEAIVSILFALATCSYALDLE